MKTVTLQTIFYQNIKIDLARCGKVIRKTGTLNGTRFDVIRIFRPAELEGNQDTIIFGIVGQNGLFLYFNKENAAVLDAAFEELGCTGEDKELCYRVG